MDLLILSEVSPTKKGHTISFIMQNLKRNYTNELIYKTEIDSQTLRMNIRLPSRKYLAGRRWVDNNIYFLKSYWIESLKLVFIKKKLLSIFRLVPRAF